MMNTNLNYVRTFAKMHKGHGIINSEKINGFAMIDFSVISDPISMLRIK